MHILLLLLLTVIAIALIGFLARRQRAERTYRRPLRPAICSADVASWTAEPPLYSTAPLVLFSERAPGESVSVLPNTQVYWPALIVRGSVGIFIDDSEKGKRRARKNTRDFLQRDCSRLDENSAGGGTRAAVKENANDARPRDSNPQTPAGTTGAQPGSWTCLSVLGPGNTFPGPLELLGIETGVKYVALDETLLQPITAPSTELVLAALEKTLLHPFLELFEEPRALAILEFFTADNFLAKNPVSEAVTSAVAARCRRIVLKEGQRMVLRGDLFWVASGSVRLVPVLVSEESQEHRKRSSVEGRSTSSERKSGDPEKKESGKKNSKTEQGDRAEFRRISSSHHPQSTKPVEPEKKNSETEQGDRAEDAGPKHANPLPTPFNFSCSEDPVFGPGSLLGVLGVLFSSCRGVFAVEAVSGEVTAYVRGASPDTSVSRFSNGHSGGSAGQFPLSAASTPSSPHVDTSNDLHTNSSSSVASVLLDSSPSVTTSLQQLFCAALKRLFSYETARTSSKKRAGSCSGFTPSLPSTLFLFVDWSACVTWKRLYPRSALFTAGSRCTSLHLINNQVLCAPGALLRDTTHTHSYVVHRLCDAVSVPSSVVERTLSRGTALAAALARRLLLHSNHRSCSASTASLPANNTSFCLCSSASSAPSPAPPLSGSVVLVVGIAADCSIFLSRLARTLLDKCTVVRGRELFRVSGGRSDGLSELLITEFLDGLRRRHRIVLVYLENDWSRMLRLVAAACDTLYVVGRSVIVPECCSVRPDAEFILLHGLPDSNVRVPRGFAWRRAANSGNSTRAVNDTKSSFGTGVARGRGSESTSASGLGSGATDSEAGSRDTALSQDVPPYRRIHHVFCPEEDGHCMKDFERIARCLSGERIGLVLGGGGARGLAHIGVIQALEEENIPIDCIGGTSMGAFVGALYARHLSFTELYSRSRAFSRRCSSYFYTLLDITYPYVSLFTGRTFDAALKAIFGSKTLIQDLWLEYYCITTDLLDAAECVISAGTVWQWVRASMSICGYLPPVVAPSTKNNDSESNKQTFYVDGAYVNNVPCDVMQRTHGMSTIIAVDVADQGDAPVDHYDSLSGFVLLFKRYFRAKRYLSWREVQYRLAFLSTSQKKRAVNDERVLVIQPKLGIYRTDDFARFDEIVAAGYAAARDAIRRWRIEGRLPGRGRRRARRFSI